MSSLTTIDHLALTVADIGDSLRWYQSSFSCELVYQDERTAILQFANLRLTLVLPSMEKTHVAYVRSDTDSLGELYEQVDGIHSTFVSDPTGNPVELVAEESLKARIK